MKGCDRERTFDFVTGAYADPGHYFSEAAHDIHAQLLSEGAVVIRGANPCRDPGVFEQAVGALGFQTRDYVGGSSPRSTIQGKVMEATRTPPDWSVILHQEMAYVKIRPKLLPSSAWSLPARAANPWSGTCASWSRWLTNRH